MKKLLWTLGFFLATMVSGYSQEEPEASTWYLEKPIREIKFDGLRSVSGTELDSLVKPYIGQKFNDVLFRELQTTLYGLDYFEGFIRPEVQKADPEGNSIVLIFYVQEKPSIKEIRFIGNTRLSTQELREKISIKADDLLSSPKIRLDERALRDFYIEKGYTTARIGSEVETLENVNKVILTFKVEEGNQTLVKSITFEGISFATEGSLRGVLASKQQAFFDSGIFKEINLVQDKNNIHAYYWDRGYVDAKVLEIRRPTTLNPETQRVEMDLVFVISEGDLFTYGNTTFEGNGIFSDEELGLLVKHVPDTILSKQKTDLDYQRILDLYYENGYIFNTIEREEIRDGSIVNFVIKIIERPRAHIENIIVRGNTKTHENVILREIPLEPGDVFSKSKIIEGIRNLYNLQYFSTVNPETPQGSADGLMDVVISLEEANTAEILFGLAFSGSTDFPVSGQLKWQDRNFLGRGQTLGVEANVSPVQQSLSANFSDSWAFDQRLTLGGSFSIGHYYRTGIDQDVAFPFYTDDYIPDPYDNHTYVFTTPTTYGPITYQPGQVFPGVPDATEISTYNLKLQYQYDQENGILKSGKNSMTLDEWSFSLGLNTGYSLFTWLGRFIFGTGLNSTLQFVTYDSTIYRPANESLRENLNAWIFENSWSSRAFWDTRDFIYNPEMGTLLGFSYTVMGGFLGGSAHFTRFQIKGEANYKLVNIELTDWYTYKLIARVRSVMSFISEPLGGPGEIVAQPKHLLYVDGMTAGRGWRPTSSLQNGTSSWSINFEFRMPVVESLLWFDTFFDIFSIKHESTPLLPLSLQDLYLSYGFGLRVTNPQLPIGLYLAKTFRVDEANSVVWQSGDGIFGSDIDMRLILTFGFDLY